MPQDILSDYAFPTALVKYHGPTNYRSSRYIATMKRGGSRGDTFRAHSQYDHATGGFSGINAAVLRAAWYVYDKACPDHGHAMPVIGYVAPDTYSVTFLPEYALKALAETVK